MPYNSPHTSKRTARQRGEVCKMCAGVCKIFWNHLTLLKPLCINLLRTKSVRWQKCTHIHLYVSRRGGNKYLCTSSTLFCAIEWRMLKNDALRHLIGWRIDEVRCIFQCADNNAGDACWALLLAVMCRGREPCVRKNRNPLDGCAAARGFRASMALSFNAD